jgi:phospholipid transport system transporter-binding protein
MPAASPTVHAVSGPLTFDSVPAIYAASRAWFAGKDGMTIDLAQVSTADSAGLALLIEWLRSARKTGAALRFSNIPSQMQELIRVNGLQDTLNNGQVG